MVLTVFLAASMSAAQAPPSPAVSCIATLGSSAADQLCLGEQEAKLGAASPVGTPERRNHLEAAADHYRRASDLGTSDVRLSALTALARIYDTPQLDDPARREVVLRELIVLSPTDPRFAFDLAALQEAQAFPDTAEQTLLDARQRHADNIETYKQLAQFYARRVTALSTAAREQTPAELLSPGQPDSNGVYQIGGNFPPPRREGIPLYPDEAQAAGIQGGVQAEIVIDREGLVTDARIVKSIPLLDEAALNAVRDWRFEPTIVDGRAVPVRMVVTVNFTLSR
ncbi:MAG TPA: energy transducer TonB [Vicinamibacterales bacterium]